MGIHGAAERVGRSLLRWGIAYAREQPLQAATAVVAVVVLCVVLALLWRRYRRTPGQQLVRTIRDSEAVDVLMHPNPDPDSMACALGVAAIADHYDVEARLRYPGEIRHQENRAFRTVLEMDCERIEAAVDLDEPVVLVDHNTPRGFPGSETVSPLAVVDHHPGEGTGEEFTDVRPEYGACATILTEYFESLDAEPGETDGDGLPLDAALSTGLLYGILTDTDRLTNGCSPNDFDAAAYLYSGVDEDLLNRVANPNVEAEVLEARADAVNERLVEAPYAVSDIGTVSNVDAIPQAADELIQLEGVSTVVVLGDSDGNLHLSGRSSDDRVHMGEALQWALENVPEASAGGHPRMGGGRLPIDGDGPAGSLTREQLHDRLFAALAGER